MPRRVELWRAFGRRLTERLLWAGWTEPIQVNGRILYENRAVHLTLKCVQNERFLVSSRVRNVSLSSRPQVPKRASENILAD